MYQNEFLTVLNLRVLAPLSRLAFIVVAWLVSGWISKSSEFADDGSAVEAGLSVVAWIGSEWFSKSAELAGISAVEIGFDFRSLACIGMNV